MRLYQSESHSHHIQRLSLQLDSQESKSVYLDAIHPPVIQAIPTNAKLANIQLIVIRQNSICQRLKPNILISLLSDQRQLVFSIVRI